MKKPVWDTHPGVRSGRDLTIGERAADAVRDRMGSWSFVVAFLGFMLGWMILNGHHGVDPFPFILLNLALSALAGLQGAILLIAAKRADQQSSELAQSDHALLAQVAEKLGIEHVHDKESG